MTDNSKIIAKDDVYNNITHNRLIINGKEYKLYTSFETSKMFSGVGYVVLCTDNKFHCIDSEYFISKKDYIAKKFKI